MIRAGRIPAPADKETDHDQRNQGRLRLRPRRLPLQPLHLQELRLPLKLFP